MRTEAVPPEQMSAWHQVNALHTSTGLRCNQMQLQRCGLKVYQACDHASYVMRGTSERTNLVDVVQGGRGKAKEEQVYHKQDPPTSCVMWNRVRRNE